MNKETDSGTAEKDKSLSTLLLTQAKEEKFITCEVCGYVNSEKTAICKMCSNYLEEFNNGKRTRW